MKRYTPEQIVGTLRQADRELGKGLSVKEVCRKVEISEQTCYRWRQKYWGDEPGADQGAEGAAEGESAAAEDRRGPADRYADPQGSNRHLGKKPATPGGRRRTVEILRNRLGYSARRTCRAIGQARSSQRYEQVVSDEERRLIDEMHRLALRWPRRR